jgi:hypothetical protein
MYGPTQILRKRFLSLEAPIVFVEIEMLFVFPIVSISHFHTLLLGSDFLNCLVYELLQFG